MRIHSHYGLGLARCVLAVAATVYAFAVSTAPALHFESEMDRAAAQQVVLPVGSEDDGGSFPSPPDTHEELDCLICQVLSHQPGPSAPESAPEFPAARTRPAEPRALASPARTTSVLNARAPPHA